MLCNRNMYRRLLHLCRHRISSELIKNDLNKKIKNIGGPQIMEYPRTFEQKLILLNDPKTIQKLQIIEYGVKYKPAKKYIALLLSIAALFFFINQQRLPQRVIDHYFTISNSSDLQHWSGFILSGFMHEQAFFLYLPLLPIIHQLSRFVTNRWIVGVYLANGIINGIVGKHLVDERVKQYEVWDQQRLSYGQGNWLSLSMMLWSCLGLKGGFTALKSRLFLKSVPGLGIIRGGIPLAYICVFYLFLETYLWQTGKKNSELMGLSVLTGILSGLLLRRLAPLK